MAISSPKILAVYSGRDLIGFVLEHDKLGAEAVTPSKMSIGVFPSTTAAANAIADAAEALPIIPLTMAMETSS